MPKRTPDRRRVLAHVDVVLATKSGEQRARSSVPIGLSTSRVPSGDQLSIPYTLRVHGRDYPGELEVPFDPNAVEPIELVIGSPTRTDPTS